MSLRVSGVSGAVYVGGQIACELGPWTLAGGTIQATVRHRSYWADAPPTSIRLQLGSCEWRWRLTDGRAGDGIYRVSGPPEER